MGGKGGSGGTAISSLKASPYRSIFILCSGFVCRYRILPGGKRQVLNLVLPGDLIGFPTCSFENAINSLSSLTEVVVATVPFQAFYDLFARFPRVAVALYWCSAHKATIYSEHLINIGRRSAYERLAHLILALLMRLRAVGLAEELSYSLPLTQELIGTCLASAVRMSAGCCDHAITEGRRTGHHRRAPPDRDRPRIADATRQFRWGLFSTEPDPASAVKTLGSQMDAAMNAQFCPRRPRYFIVGVAQLGTVYADPERKIFQMNRLYVCGKVPWRPSGVSSPPNSSNAIRHAAPPQSYERAAETIPPTPRSSPLGPTDWLQSACRPAACGGRRRQKTPSRQK